MKRISVLSTIATSLIAATARAVPGSAQSMSDMLAGRTAKRTVAILLGNYAVFLDWAGPAETFYSAGFNASSKVDEFRIVSVAKNAGPLPIQVLGNFTPQYSIANAPPADVIVVPGSSLGNDPATAAWIRAALAKGAIVLSVCTGALVLARMGFLGGLSVTTHHSALSALAHNAPSAKVVENVPYVDNGQIVLSAGTITGIDAALHIVARLTGEQRAADEREYLEYEWRAS